MVLDPSVPEAAIADSAVNTQVRNQLDCYNSPAVCIRLKTTPENG
jgi:hypothetical protein